MSDRSNLRLVIARLIQAQDYTRKIAGSGDLLFKIEEAKEAALVAIDPYLIKCGQYEPLDGEEEIVHDNLKFVLRLNDELWAELTAEQKFSAARVIMRQGGPTTLQHPVTITDYLGLSFKNIFVGIEKDGYAHS